VPSVINAVKFSQNGQYGAAVGKKQLNFHI